MIDEFVSQGLLSITFTGGEPLLYKDIKDLISYSFSNGCQVKLFSNVNLIKSKKELTTLKESGLCYLETSIYGDTAELHDHISGVPGSFEKTLQVVRWANELNLAITIKTSWLRENWKYYDRIINFARDMNAYFRGSSTIMPNRGSDKNLQHRMRLEDMVELHKIDLLHYGIRNNNQEKLNSDKKFCNVANHSLAVGPDGSIYPCLHLRTKLGNIVTDNISKIWTDSAMLKKIRNLRMKDFDYCDSCEWKKYCFICIGDAYTENKDLTVPSKEACLLSQARFIASSIITNKNG